MSFYTEDVGNANFDAKLALADTADLAEGTNLYYTTERSEAVFDAKLALANTADLAEGTNLYYTDVRADARAEAVFENRFGDATTDDLTEGANKYFTAANANLFLANANTQADIDGGDGIIAFGSQIVSQNPAVTHDVVTDNWKFVPATDSAAALDVDFECSITSYSDDCRVACHYEVSEDSGSTWAPALRSVRIALNGGAASTVGGHMSTIMWPGAQTLGAIFRMRLEVEDGTSTCALNSASIRIQAIGA